MTSRRVVRLDGKLSSDYGVEFRKLKELWRPVVERGEALCMEPLCIMPERRIVPGTPWDLCHSQDRLRIIGPGHRACNLTAAARLGNAARWRKTPPRPVLRTSTNW